MGTMQRDAAAILNTPAEKLFCGLDAWESLGIIPSRMEMIDTMEVPWDKETLFRFRKERVLVFRGTLNGSKTPTVAEWNTAHRGVGLKVVCNGYRSSPAVSADKVTRRWYGIRMGALEGSLGKSREEGKTLFADRIQSPPNAIELVTAIQMYYFLNEQRTPFEGLFLRTRDPGYAGTDLAVGIHHPKNGSPVILLLSVKDEKNDGNLGFGVSEVV